MLVRGFYYDGRQPRGNRLKSVRKKRGLDLSEHAISLVSQRDLEVQSPFFPNARRSAAAFECCGFYRFGFPERVQLTAHHGNLFRSIDADADLVAVDGNYGDGDAGADVDLFPRLPGQDKHDFYPP